MFKHCHIFPLYYLKNANIISGRNCEYVENRRNPIATICFRIWQLWFRVCHIKSQRTVFTWNLESLELRFELFIVLSKIVINMRENGSCMYDRTWRAILFKCGKIRIELPSNGGICACINFSSPSILNELIISCTKIEHVFMKHHGRNT